MDCFVGKTAVTDIYPTILTELEGYQPMASFAQSAADSGGLLV